MHASLTRAVALVLVCFVVAYAVETDTKSLKGVTVLWDRAQGWPSISPLGEYGPMGQELQKMGATITDLQKYHTYSDESLDGIDIVIIAERRYPITAPEQQALVRYIRSGGSLLVLARAESDIGAVNAVITNFGLMFTATTVHCTKFDAFLYPATTDRRPIDFCEVQTPVIVETRNDARAILGRAVPAAPAKLFDCCLGALGRGGDGRVIAIGEFAVWRGAG